MVPNTAGGECAAPLLEMRAITKHFGDLKANDQVDLEVRQGEVHALLGENGAGKTTLMNILYGLVSPDHGEIYLNGRLTHISSPRDAIRQRIGMVHQHFMLIPSFTVVENVILGLPVEREPLLDLKQAAAQVSALANQFGLQVDPFAKVGELPVGVQQRIEILKTLYRGARLLILDEPTAVLSPGEVRELFRVLKSLVAQGLAAIFISHKLDEVLEVSDRITVLRRGRKVCTLATRTASKQQLAELMVGHQVFGQSRPEPHPFGPVTLALRQLCALDDSGRMALRNISLEVRAGEILGVAGVDGNGQQQLAEVLAGLRPSVSGQIIVCGQDLTNHPPSSFIRRRVGYVPADRQQVGLILDFSVDENLIVKRLDQPPFSRWGWLHLPAIRAHAQRVIDAFDIRLPGSHVKARQLSGGNQQKVVLAREIEDRPMLLIAMHPTRGLDIGATEYVHQRLLEQRSQGVAILLISTELEEVLSLCDRVCVLFRGEVMGTLDAAGAQVDLIGHMMLGERLESLAAIPA